MTKVEENITVAKPVPQKVNEEVLARFVSRIFQLAEKYNIPAV